MSKKTPRSPIYYPITALILEIIALLIVRSVYTQIYQNNVTSLLRWEFTLNYLSLFVGGILAGIIGIVGLYKTWIYHSPKFAFLITVLLNIPVLLGAAFFTYAMLVF